MKILLFALNGSYSHTNLAIRCLRPYLEKEQFEVAFLERNLRDRTSHILEDVVKSRPDIVGFSTYIWNLRPMLDIASALKKVLPNCIIVFGGPEVSFDTERFLNLPYIDAIVCGEGEETFTQLCKDVRDGKPYAKIIPEKCSQNVMKDEGILYRPGDFPNNTMVYYESSRGCPFSCAYCLSSATQGTRCKTVEQTLQDLQDFEKLSKNIKIIKFVDRTFNAPIQRANQIWRSLLDEKFTCHYHFEVCASLLNEESFTILEQFPKGKIQLEFGLQSTYEPTLQAVSRHIQPQQVLSSVKRIHDMGNIHVHLDLIAGLPYEDLSRFEKSFDDAYFCCDLLQLGFLKLLHGTTLRDHAEEYGMKFLEEAPYTVLQTKWLSYEDLCLLKSIAETLERYMESGNFEHTLHFLLHLEGITPFAFYRGLTNYIFTNDTRRLQKISQKDAYLLLDQYVRTLHLTEDQLQMFESNLHEDYASNEVRKLHIP